MNDRAVNLENYGDSICERLLAQLETTVVAEFADLAHLKDLAGNDTGHIHVYQADRLVKMSFLSISVGAGRYFNIHVIPDPHYDVPRFLHEGMLLPMGSQISLDLFPDIDEPKEVLHLLDLFSGVTKVYDQARQDPDLQFQPSRQLHMRAFSSPMFLCAFGVDEAKLPKLDRYAHGYLNAWLQLYRNAPQLSAEAAAERAARRAHMSRTIIDLDPDRGLVVDVYGEQTTQAIERASML